MIRTHLERGKTQFQEFMKGLENKDACKLYEPIKKNKLYFFQQEPLPSDTKKKVLKKRSRLCFSSSSHASTKCDLQEFFRHEKQPFPAALSDCGKLHYCQKSQFAAILEAELP